jgi:hypothetical protein
MYRPRAILLENKGMLFENGVMNIQVAGYTAQV